MNEFVIKNDTSGIGNVISKYKILIKTLPIKLIFLIINEIYFGCFGH